MTNPLDELLKRDALNEAEQMTGKSYKEDEATSWLGLLNHMQIGDQKKRALMATSDVYWGADLATYDHVFRSLGFEMVLEVPFLGRELDGVRTGEVLRFWYHPDGMFAKYDTWRGTGVNTVDLNYQIRFHSDDWGYGVTSSGRMVDDRLWSGHHDGREGLRHTIAKLRDAGSFVNPWPSDDNTMFSFMHYCDTEPDRDHDAWLLARVNAANERYPMLPKDVQNFLGPIERYNGLPSHYRGPR